MKKIGHRGAAGHAPENTLASFRKALELGVDGIEFDVHVSADGEPVVIHDETLERTTTGKGYVRETPVSELKKLDAGKGERIPTLREALDCIGPQKEILVELKSADSPGPVAAVLKEYAESKGWGYANFLIVSFNHHWLVEITRINPKLAIGATLVGIPHDYARLASDIRARSINPANDYVNKDFVTDAHARGVLVYVWTPNTPEKIAKVKALEVDAIISDYPDRL